MRPQLYPLERVQEIEVGRRIIDRVPAQNQQRLHRAIAHVLDQFSERGDFIHWIRFYRINVDDGLTCVAERLIDCMNESVARSGSTAATPS